nr:DUF6538 domain-containing protein [Celeribacter ethanolicus]
MTIMKRGSTYHLRKRVPRRYEGVEERKSIWVSLHTDSLTVAQQKAPIAWQHIVEGWEARLAGDTSDAEKRFEAAKNLAAVRGFRYLPAPQIAKLPQDQLLARVEAVKERKDGELDMRDTAALMGGVSEPAITVTRALELYWGLAADKTLGKSPDQLRRWENPRKKAVKNFVDVVGDKAIGDITGDDMLEFRDWWFDRMRDQGLTPNSGNKDLIHLGDVLKTVNRMKRLGLVLAFAATLRIGGRHTTGRGHFNRRDQIAFVFRCEGFRDVGEIIRRSDQRGFDLCDDLGRDRFETCGEAFGLCFEVFRHRHQRSGERGNASDRTCAPCPQFRFSDDRAKLFRDHQPRMITPGTIHQVTDFASHFGIPLVTKVVTSKRP